MTKVEPLTGRVGSPPRRRRFTRKRWRGAGFLLPFLIPFALFYIAPIAYAVWESLFRLVRPEGIFGKPQLVFAGLSQYGDVLANPDFRDGIGRVLIFAAIQIPVVIVLAVTLVLALDSSRARFPRFFRLAYFVPYAVPTVVSTIPADGATGDLCIEKGQFEGDATISLRLDDVKLEMLESP